jgi:hypothetical protein
MSARRLAVLLLVAAGAETASGAVAASPPEKPPAPEASKPAPADSLPRVQIVAIDPDTLPVADIPNIVNATPPKVLPDDPEPVDIEVRVPGGGKPLRPIRDGHRFDVELQGATGSHIGFQSGHVFPSQRPVDFRSVIVLKCGAGLRPTALRWERFAADPSSDVATLEIATGWFDPSACRAVAVTRTTSHPAPVGRFRARPLAYAARAGQTLVVFLPQGSRLAADANGGEASIVTGENPRVVLPLVRGGAASFAAEVESSMLEMWRAGIEGQINASPSGEGNVSVRFGVDVLQPVSEDRPSVLLRIETANGSG